MFTGLFLAPQHQKNPSVQGEETSGLEGVAGSCCGDTEVLNQGGILGQRQSRVCQAWPVTILTLIRDKIKCVGVQVPMLSSGVIQSATGQPDISSESDW